MRSRGQFWLDCLGTFHITKSLEAQQSPIKLDRDTPRLTLFKDLIMQNEMVSVQRLAINSVTSFGVEHMYKVAIIAIVSFTVIILTAIVTKYDRPLLLDISPNRGRVEINGKLE
jgi:putative Mn2+ efflux pump MntP